MNKNTSRRSGINATKRVYRKLDPTPVEIPAGRKTIPSTREMVRQTVQAALAQAGADHGYESADQMIQEETDLEQIDPDPPWSSQYEVTEMEDIEPPAPLEEAPPKVGEQKDDGETENKDTDQDDPPSNKQE